MQIPVKGIIERRILINFTADPAFTARIIPAPFRPKLYKGKAIVGICLIRLKNIRPKGFPAFMGIRSENGAHRIAVEWEEGGGIKEGVYVPRRDTSLRFNSLVGGRLFPGVHHLADFNVKETDDQYHIDFTSSDDTTISIDAKRTTKFNKDSIFETLQHASGFFEKGSIGYSPNKNRFEGLELKTFNWEVKPLEVLNVRSSFFENEQLFPKGTILFDNALLMTNIDHEWHGVK